MTDWLQLAFYRFAAGGWVPAGWFEPNLPDPEQRTPLTGRLKLEVVSHCWNYARFLVYQLSSLVLFPPESTEVTMTVFYASEDEETSKLLAFFSERQVSNVRWNWCPLPRQELFRRGIGRNKAALGTQADWVWFTDCDLMFRDDCLDTLGERLQGERHALVFPREERRTALLAEDSPMFGTAEPAVLDIDTREFTAREMTKATGPLQIAHGDVCRSVGYCRNIGIYQKPSPTWCKAYEDRAFRWLLRTPGKPLNIPGVYRIRHISKGRYTGGQANTRLRTRLRLIQSRIRGT